jgi:putative aminopeptidase FrvX
MSDIKSLLERLSNAHGVSGYESNIRKIIETEIRSFVDEIRIDKMGNLIATKNGGSPSLMLAAHMDEIGLMAKYVDDTAYAKRPHLWGYRFKASTCDERRRGKKAHKG